MKKLGVSRNDCQSLAPMLGFDLSHGRRDKAERRRESGFPHNAACDCNVWTLEQAFELFRSQRGKDDFS